MFALGSKTLLISVPVAYYVTFLPLPSSLLPSGLLYFVYRSSLGKKDHRLRRSALAMIVVILVPNYSRFVWCARRGRPSGPHPKPAATVAEPKAVQNGAATSPSFRC
jgi:hypothetical protein